MRKFRVHMLVKSEKDYETDVFVEAVNSVEASKRAIQQYADKGVTAHTISVWHVKEE